VIKMVKQQTIKIIHPITGRVYVLKTIKNMPTFLELSINNKVIGTIGMSEIRVFIQKE